MQVDVSSSGAISLGDTITCDGFVFKHPIRVQTHVHEDHMVGFDSSKGYQRIIMTRPTRDLLVVEYDADIPYRENIEAVPTGQAIAREGCEILLLDNGHMLGSVQVAVTQPNGLCCGYSGDFAWPLEDVIEVDELVLDSTYGSPDSVRKFTQDEAVSRFLELVVERVRHGPVLILAHRGTLQRAVCSLDDVTKHPILASPRLCSELRVYQQHGYGLTRVLTSDSEEARQVISEGKYIRVYGTGDRRPTDPSGATSIVLSAYRSRTGGPVVAYSDNAFAVALSDHADYKGTLAYVRATGAKKVVTDNTRGGHAVELALGLRRELNIEAQPSQNQLTKEWGT